ncbi:lysine-rich nucleolar protein 1 isoform X1 [Poecile atricapillus]|uniref:lysine-rich nucleolar protein 1 isoform X1 n=1 Tax=Poecile atricapillus TaxID=48891 RepID=UPI00273A2479|nr:lysine-rich nucleolar protein 1 isoform X1 [Poecile atricapillus]XP_058706045.1 lysine-rich nucleolar protein 1 isoform X1 [Poecile atricapillus]
MIIKHKRKEFLEEPGQKKKKVKAIIKIEEDVQTVIKTGDNGHLKKKTKTRKKEDLKDEYLYKSQPKNSKKKKKKKGGSELLRERHLESFVNIKGHLDLQLQEESEEQVKILKKKKRNVQCHFSLENNESSDVDLSNHHRDSTKRSEFSFKKKRKSTALDLELDGEVTKKKKKKHSFSLEDIQDSEKKQSAKVCKNTHKYITQEVVFMGENYGTGHARNGGETCVRRKKKEKKKDKSDWFLPLTDNQDNVHQGPGSPTALSDFRKRKKHNSWEFTLTNREEEDKIKNFGCIKERKKKRKRKDTSSSTCEEDKPDCSHSIPDRHLPAQQEVELEEEELSGKRHRKNFKGKNEVSKKKKKKTKKKEEETTYSEVYFNNGSASKSQKMLLESNKKNKESEMERAQCVAGDAVDGALCNRNPVLHDRKRKKTKKVPPQDFTEEPGSKADTKKMTESAWTESLEHLDGVIIVREKKGNCDEINIDKVRRQALQEEIDRESGKIKAFSSKVGQNAKLGQWSTATFKSSEEQTKFFRLMGGFKKGSVPTQNPSGIPNKPNMALNKEGEEKLQQALKMEFDKAMDLKQHRGIGLGFQPTANKKVYIDKYTSRSIKFED